MTNEQLFKLLGSTDDALLDENVEVTTSAPKRRWIAWTAAAAACVCLCAVGARFLPEMLPRSEEMTAATGETTGDDTMCNNFWVPLENGIRYEACSLENAVLPEESNSQPIQFILDPWHMEYQIIDPTAPGNAEIERGTYTFADGVYTLTSPDGLVTILDEYDEFNTERGFAWDFIVRSCDSYPYYAGRCFTSRMQGEKPFAEMETLAAVIAEDVMMPQAQVNELTALLKELTVYQTLTVPEEDAEGKAVANLHLTYASASQDICFYDQWMLCSDGTAWLADKEQVAQIVALHQEVLASNVVVDDSWYPFAELDASAISGIEVYRLAANEPGSFYLEKEIPDLVALLQNVTAYEEDPEFGETVGSLPYELMITGTDGETTAIGIYEGHIFVDDNFGDTFYIAGSNECAAVRDWIDAVLNNALWQGWGTEANFGETTAVTPDEVQTFIAQIAAIEGNNITVGAVINGGSIEPGESESSCLYSFSTEGLLMHDASGAELSLADFAVGDTVYVSYTGEVLETDPCVIVTPTKLQLHAE